MVIVNDAILSKINDYLTNYQGLAIECEDEVVKAFPELPRLTIRGIISKHGQHTLKRLYFKFSSRSAAILAE